MSPSRAPDPGARRDLRREGAGANGRPDLRGSLARDLARLERRRGANRAFWRSLGVLGTVGWAIALPGVAGALLGRALDAQLGSGVRFTLMLLVAGVLLGSVAAWHIVRRHQR